MGNRRATGGGGGGGVGGGGGGPKRIYPSTYHAKPILMREKLESVYRERKDLRCKK